MNEHFWSIVIEQDTVQVGLWTIKGENVSVLAAGKAFQWETDEDLVEKIDAGLTEVSDRIPEEATEPSKTIFGVPASWVEDGHIKRPHLDKIRTVSKSLSLSPMGFVVLPEAIAHAVKIREGSPLSGVVVGVGKGSLDVTVFRLGNIVGTVSVGRSVSLVEDMVEGLSRFSAGESVPTRWLLYDGVQTDLEETKQEFIKADWKVAGENLKFLHTPQVETISEQEKVEAVSIAGASELGEIKGIEGKESELANVTVTHEVSHEDLGFVIDRDIREEVVHEGPAAKQFLHPNVPVSFGFLKKFKPRMPQVDFGRKRVGVVIFGFLILVVGGLMAAWFYLSSADVTIYLSPKNLQEAETVVLDTNISTPDLANFTFPATRLETKAVSEKTKPATGVKTVGDPARGRVVISNGTVEEVKLNQGTVLTGPDGLKFTLDEGVTVPEAQSPRSPGEVSASVTAVSIGEDGNLAKDESFSVANFPRSEVDAVSEEDFSGGVSREARVVSQDDISKLRSELAEELRLQARRDLESSAFGSRFIAEVVEYEVINETVSARVGEEADAVTMTMTIGATGLALPESQVAEMSQLILREQIPEGFSLRSEQVEATFELVDEIADGAWEFDVGLSANLLPSVDVDLVRKEVAGRRPGAAEQYLARIPGYESSVIVVRPSLPGFLGNLPRVGKNISVEVIAER